jgi:hypothetical protein
MKTSEQINELATALAKARGEFNPITRSKEVKVKTKEGGAYTFSYAPLDSILATVVPVLSANDLVVCQGEEEGWLVSRIIHKSGQWLESRVRVLFQSGNAQAYGGALTYARRYGISELLGIAADEDDDANAECGNTVEASRQSDEKPWFNDFANMRGDFIKAIQAGKRTPEQIIQNLQEKHRLSVKTKEEIRNLGATNAAA